MITLNTAYKTVLAVLGFLAVYYVNSVDSRLERIELAQQTENTQVRELMVSNTRREEENKQTKAVVKLITDRVKTLEDWQKEFEQKPIAR